MYKSVFSFRIKLIFFLINFSTLFIILFFQYKYQIVHLEDRFNYDVENIINKEFSNNISTTKGVLTSLSSYYNSSAEMNTSSFSKISNDLLNSYSFIKGIGFATIVHQNEKKIFYEELQESGFYDFHLKSYDNNGNLVASSKKHNIYAPVIYIEPSTAEYSRFVGFDIYNDPKFNDLFKKAARENKVIIKDRFIDGLNINRNIFIKSTYIGIIEKDDPNYLEKNANGFYFIDVSLEKILESVKNKFIDYEINIVKKDYYIDNKVNNKYFIEELDYFKKIDGFDDSYLYVKKQLILNDFDYVSFLFVMSLVILIQVLYVFIWYKDRSSKNELSFKASHDELTGLTNRTYFKSEFDRRIFKERKNKRKKQMAILFIDIDKFKGINDSFGHKFGDKVLIEISNRFKNIMRNDDVICRHGGDEFLILIDKIEDVTSIVLIIKKIMKSMEESIMFNNQKIYLTLSIGASLFPNDGLTVDDLLKNADSAMYKAKDEGRNTFKFYTEDMTFKIMKKVLLENKLRDAIFKDEFIVYYQAQYNGENDKIIGMEALVRWKNEEGLLIPPGKFIPIAEETGLIIELDRLVMKKAISQYGIWKKNKLFEGTLSLNLSLKQLKNDDFITLLKEVLLSNNCEAKDIELEITEGEIMENPLDGIAKLKELSRIGIKLSVDDFGTGYSSLAYLKKLPINKLKIDREFVKDIPDDEDDMAITKSIIALAKSLNLDLIAEGVENKEQKDFLLLNGCNKIQGFYYGRPIDSQSFEEVLINKKN